MPTPKEESEALMNDLLPLAKRMLSEEGEFYPYGGLMRPSGEIVHIGAKIEGTSHPDSKSVIEVLTKKLKASAQASDAKATAIIFDVRIAPPGKSEKTDAIQVSLDHAEGFSAEVFFPYAIENERDVVFGRTFAQKGDGVMFD
jgi:hypothetical protein